MPESHPTSAKWHLNDHSSKSASTGASAASPRWPGIARHLARVTPLTECNGRASLLWYPYLTVMRDGGRETTISRQPVRMALLTPNETPSILPTKAATWMRPDALARERQEQEARQLHPLPRVLFLRRTARAVANRSRFRRLEAWFLPLRLQNATSTPRRKHGKHKPSQYQWRLPHPPLTR